MLTLTANLVSQASPPESTILVQRSIYSVYIPSSRDSSHPMRLSLSPRVIETLDSLILSVSAPAQASRRAAPSDHLHKACTFVRAGWDLSKLFHYIVR